MSALLFVEQGSRTRSRGFGGGAEYPVEQRLGLLRRVLAVALLARGGRLNVPERLHLLVAVLALHLFVVEGVARLRGAPRPENRLGRVREVAAREVGRRVDLVPRDVVQNLVAESLQREADAVDVVRRARDPDCAVRLEQALALFQPHAVEFVYLFKRRGLVPGALVDADHLARLAGDAVVREKVGRVRENHVEHLGARAAQQFQGIALVETNPVLLVNEDRVWNGLRHFSSPEKIIRECGNRRVGGRHEPLLDRDLPRTSRRRSRSKIESRRTSRRGGRLNRSAFSSLRRNGVAVRRRRASSAR